MISVAYLCITCLCWLFAFTLGSPLALTLLISKSFRASFFAWFYTQIETFFQTRVSISRKKTFQILKDNLSDKSKALEVLEIGAAHGPNLKFYPENCFLTVLDKNKAFEPYFLENLKRYPSITYRGTVTQNAEKMTNIKDASFDLVISSYLHCSTDNSKAVLQEIKRVLKPGGKYLFLDHVKFPDGDFGLYLQKMMSPLWILCTNGCIMYRDTEKTIKEAGFSDFKYEKLVCKDFILYFIRHQIAGIATK